MSEEVPDEKPVLTKKEKTKADKQAEHIARIKRTLVASLIGIATGALSYWSGGIPNAAGLQNNGYLAFMLMVAGIVIQKHIFVFLGSRICSSVGTSWSIGPPGVRYGL